jgi:hypothetical protein
LVLETAIPVDESGKHSPYSEAKWTDETKAMV